MVIIVDSELQAEILFIASVLSDDS